MNMTRSTFAALATAAMAAAALGLAPPATAVPSGPGSPQDTVDTLQSQGYKVILNKVGSAPLQQCAVTAVRPGTDITHRVSDSGRQEGSVAEVLYTTVYVDVKC
jgi:hypothetical protein